MFGYATASVVYVGVLALAYYRRRLAIRYDPLLVVPVVLLWVLFLIGLVRNPVGQAPLRTGAYIVFSALNLFVIPATFTREQFVDALTILATTLVLLAIPVAVPALVFDTGQAGVWGQGTLPPLTSVFTNPNDLAALSVLGLVASLGTIRPDRHLGWSAGGLLVCTLGLLLARGRAALLGAIGVFVLLTAYKLLGRRAVLPVVVAGIVAVLCVIVAALSDVLGTDLTRTLFNHRAGLWQAAIRAVADRPVLGWGPVDDGPILVAHDGPTPGGKARSAHSSFFRMFVMTGISGGVLYLTLCGGALFRGVQLINDPTARIRYVPLSLLAVVLVLGLFNNSPIFGLNFVSVFSALAVGYTARAKYTTWIRGDGVSSSDRRTSQS